MTLCGHRRVNLTVPSWEFERDSEIVKISPTPRVIANNIDLEVAAATQGLGLIATFAGFLDNELKSGTLEPVLEDWLQPFSGPFLYYASRRHMPAPLRAFVDFISVGQTSRPSPLHPNPNRVELAPSIQLCRIS